MKHCKRLSREKIDGPSLVRLDWDYEQPGLKQYVPAHWEKGEVVVFT